MEATNITAQQCLLFSIPIKTTDGYVNGFRGGLVSNSIRTNRLDNQFNHSGTEDSLSGTDHDHDHDHDQDQSISDCESVISGPTNEEQQLLFGDGLIRVEEEDRFHEVIKRRFFSGLGSIGLQISLVSIHRNSCSSFKGQARLQSFHIFARAMEKKCGSGTGNANLKYAWYGASKEEILNIVSYGFGHCGNVDNNKGLFGRGIYLAPDDSSIDNVLKSSTVDEDGLRHVLLCRVILGNLEVVHPGSEQSHPSSEEFDSGVDNLEAPKKYIVWSTHMNTHILPEYIISFRAPLCLEGGQSIEAPLRKPTSPWMPFSTLISVLSKFLPPRTINLLSNYHNDYRERKIPRHELIRQVREMAGDKLLSAVIKSFRNKQFNASIDLSTTKSSRSSHRSRGRNSECKRSGRVGIC